MPSVSFNRPVPALAQIFLFSPSYFVGWCVLALMLGLIGVASECWRGAEWARLTSGFAGVAIAAVFVANPDVLAHPVLVGRKVAIIALLVASGAASFDLLRPATRGEFREVREARARLRAAKGQP